MTDYQFNVEIVVDPDNPINVVQNGAVYLYDPSDEAGVSPIALKDPSGLPMPNPLTSNPVGALNPFVATIPQVKWKSGEYEGFFHSYKGLRDEAVAAVAAVEGMTAGAVTTGEPGTPAAVVISGASPNRKFDFTIPQGLPGLDGSNVLPTDDAIEQAIKTPGTKTGAALDAAFVGAAELVINAERYPTVQDALDAAPRGSTVYFPATMSPVAVPAGGFVLKSSGLIIDAMGCDFQVASWGTPAFLGLRSNNAGDDHTFRIGKVTYTGVRGNHTGATIRGSAPYCSGCGVWVNGDRNFVEYLRTDGMPTPIFFASWDGVGMNDRTGTGNRIGYLEASGYDFALLYVKQTAFDWGNAYCHDDIDDSGGVNPTHAIYCSASSGHRSGSGQVGRWYTERNLYGHAYLAKFADRLTFGSLVSDDCAGVASFQNVEDLTGDILTGTRVRGIANDRSVVFSGAEFCKRVKIGRIDVRKVSGDQTPGVGLWVDDRCQIGSITVETEHVAGVATSVPEVWIRGTGVCEVGSITVNAKGVPVRPVELGDGTVAGQAAGWIIPIVRSQGSDAVFNGIPVAEYALSHSNAWGDGGNWLTGTLPTKGIYRRGMRWAAFAPSVGTARGWAQTVNGALSGATWAATTAVAAGAWVKLADGRVVRYRTAGTTGATEPNPTTIGSTGTDGTVTWEYMSVTSGTVVSEGNL